MKMILPIMIIVGVLLIGGVQALDYGTYNNGVSTWTNIENATTYYCGGSWDVTDTCDKVIDNNWSTIGHSSGSGANVRIWMNYSTKYIDTEKAIYWQTRRHQDAANGKNLTLTSDCYNAEEGWLKFKAENWINGAAGGYRWYCWDGDSYDNYWGVDGAADNNYLGLYEESLWAYFYGVSYLNLTFSEEVNFTVDYENGETNDNSTNFTMESYNMGEGIVTVTFGDQYQIFKYENEDYNSSSWNWTHIEKDVYVFDNADKNQLVRVWDGADNIENANVWIEKPTATGYQIVYGRFTDGSGEMYATLESGETYRFCVYHEDYETVCENHEVIPSVSDTIVLELEGGYTEHIHYWLTSTCSLYEQSAKNCVLTIGGNGQPSNITFYWMINETGTEYSSEYTYIHPTETIVLDWTNATINGTVWIDGTEYFGFRHEMIDYTWTIGELPDFSAADNEEKGFAILIWILISSIIGGIANTVIRGSGIYTYAIIMALMGASLQVLVLPALMVAMLIIYTAGRKIIGG